MKISYIAPCVGACAAMMMTSCSSANKDADGYNNATTAPVVADVTESALPMSEVADGEIPPWLLDDDGTNGAQMDAGARTPEYSRNDFSIPEPTETVAAATAAQTAAASSGGLTSQNQPTDVTSQNQPTNVAPPAPEPEQDNPFVEVVPHPMDGVVDPLATTSTYTPAPTKTTSSSSSSSSGKKQSSSKSTSSKSTGSKSTNKKETKSKKPKQPTMVVYKVRPGDNLSEIASRSNTTVKQIMQDSNLKSTTIHPGQVIKVRYTPKGYKENKKTGSTNSKSGKTHTITSGQTLSGIAAKYGVTTSQLMKANGLTDADAKKIQPGQTLKIPAKSKN